MKKLFAALAILAAFAATPVAAQTSPNLRQGQVLTAAQWNALFVAKQDYLGSPPVVLTNIIGVAPIVTTVVGSTVQISYSGSSSSPIHLTGVGTTAVTGNGQLVIGTSPTAGALLLGQGSTSDVSIENHSGSVVCSVPTGTTQINCSLVQSPTFLGNTTATGSATVQGSSETASAYTGSTGGSGYTCSMSGSVLTVGGSVTGFLAVGDTVSGGVANASGLPLVISSFGTATGSPNSGGTGTYNMSNTGSGSGTCTNTSSVLHVTAISVSPLHVSDLILGGTIYGKVSISSQISGSSGSTGLYALSSAWLNAASTSFTGTPNDTVNLKAGLSNRIIADAIGNLYINNPTDPIVSLLTLGIKLNSLSGVGYVGMEGATPTILTVDTTGSGGGSTTSHSSVWDTVAYDSAGVRWDSAFKMNPGFAYSHSGHMQSDIDWLGYFDGKGVVGLLAYSTGCTTAGNGSGPGACSINANPAFIPVPDANSAFVPAVGGVIPVSSIAAVTIVSSKFRLQIASTTNYTSGMYCYVTGVTYTGTAYVNGKHICNVIDSNHLEIEDVASSGSGFGGSPTVGVMNPTDLGGSGHQWNDVWYAGMLLQGFSGITAPTVPAATAGTVNDIMAQNCSLPNCVGNAFMQYLNGVEQFQIWSLASGTLITEQQNAGISFVTNAVGGGSTRMFIGPLGGVSIGAGAADPGVGNISITPSTYIGGLSSTVPACSAGLEGTLAAITTSTTVTWGANIAGGGSSHVLGYCDGTNWTVAAK